MSNTNISDIAIKLSVNADGVSKGFRTAAEEARSYKAELDRLVYAVGKNDPVDYNAHVQQFMQVTNERLAREKKAQEEFNAWYNKEMDREVAMFIAAETQKEQATQARIAAERQAALYTHNMQQIVQARPLPAESESRGVELRNLEEAIRRRYALLDQEQQLIQNQVAMNTRNAQRFQATLEMETTARAQANAQLQAAITARYALLDTEERALRDNAANAAAADARKVAAAEQIRQQELANLRTYIQQKYALLDQEERAVRDNATNAAAAQARTSAQTEQSHQQDLANLRTYIQQKYALLDQEERAIRDNAANLAAAQALAVRNAQQTHEQDLQNLREYITQKYAILNREEAIEKMNASNAAEIARLRNMRARQAADAANAQRDADFAAYKADLARQEAAADDDRVRQLNDWRMQQALMQRATVDTQLTVARMNGGFGGAAMAIGQASYAAEDFIQVLSMGGGLNMALMSASNNLSMVVRSLMGTSVAMSAVAGLAVPAMLIGTNLLIQYLSKEEGQIDAVTAAYKRLREEMKLTADLRMIELEHSFNMEDIDALSSYAAAMSRLKQEVRDLARAETEIAAIEEEINAQRNDIRDTVAGGTIIADAERRLEAIKEIGRTLQDANYDAVVIAEAEAEVRKLTEAYTELANTMKHGTPDEMVRAAEELERVINESDRIFAVNPGDQIERLRSIIGSEDGDLEKLDALRQLMSDIAVEEDKRLKMEEEMLKLQEKRDQLLRQETQLRQDEMRFRLSATEAQREELAIRQQLAEFLGVNATGMDFGDMSADQAGQSKEFLELLWRNLKQQREDLLAEQRNVTPTGGLEQDTFQAQADAFKQMLEAQNKEDPQLASIDRRMQQVNQYLEIITQIPGFQIVQ